MRDEESFSMLLEYLESTFRAISHAFRILISKMTDDSRDTITDKLQDIKQDVQYNKSLLLDLKRIIIFPNHFHSPSCISLDDSVDLLDP